MPRHDFAYVGSELTLFAKALVWKSYLHEQICPFLKGRVAEVGAGSGAITAVMANSAHTEWLALEPDKELARNIQRTDRIQVLTGTLADLEADELFDVILYIDVLEHIENDSVELQLAASHLRLGGYLIVLAPAHNFLFSEFDQAIGHFRRYDRARLKRIAPQGLTLRRMRYLDSIGLFASLTNRAVLKQANPKESQVLFWDRVLVRISKMVDPLLCYLLGKSILGIWKKSL